MTEERSKEDREEFVIGVHFGCEELRYAVYDNGNFFIIPNREGKYNTPILINFDKYGEMFIGGSAKYNIKPYTTMGNLHKIIGKTFKQIKQMSDYPFSYNISDRFNKPYLNINFENGTLEMTVEEALSFFFKEIKKDSEIFLNKNISQIILSIPDSFEDDQELALKAAANKGGLTVLKTIKDSSAAIYGYSLNEVQEEKNILTINAGLESTDFVLNTVENNNIEVVGKVSAFNIGATHFDKEFETYLTLQYDNRNSKVSRNSNIIEELKEEVKDIRQYLNVFYEADFHWNNINRDVDYVNRITRAKLDELMYKPISKILDSITNLLSDVQIKRSDISQIILSGSLFTIPKLQKEISNYFYGLELRTEKNFEDVIVEGASIVGFNTRERFIRSNIVLLNAVRFNMGIEVSNGMFQAIVLKGTPLPIKMSEKFTFTFDNQDRVHIKVLEGEKSTARGNSFLGKIPFDYVSKGVRSFVIFNVEFVIDRNGEITVTATDIGLGITKSLFIKRNFEKFDEQSNNNGMDENALKKDVNTKQINDIRNEIETIAYEIKAHMTSKSTVLKRIKIPIDYLILEQSIEEIILWLENRSLGEVIEIEEVKKKFESTIKPILSRAYGE